jgi:Phosphotransferase enzyme family
MIGESLISELAAQGWPVDALVQRSFPSTQNDRVFYYGYRGATLAFIATAYRAPGDREQILRNEIAIVDRIRQRMTSTESRTSILVPTLCVTRSGEVLAVSEYVRPHKSFARGRRRLRDYKNALATSSEWLSRFQTETAESRPGHDGIRTQFADRVERYVAKHGHYLPPAFRSASDGLVRALEDRPSLGPASACHGDFCFWNYLIDDHGQFRVYDWETARTCDYVVRDFFSNIITYALAARSDGQWDGNFGDLLRTDVNPTNAIKRLLSSEVRAFAIEHDLPNRTMGLGLVYSFICLMLRMTSPQTIHSRSDLVSELAMCLPE